MSLDPKAQKFLQEQAAQAAANPQPPFDRMTSEAVRRLLNGILLTLDGAPSPVAKVEERTIPGPAVAIPVRIYTPPGESPFPALIYFHGGGWVVGNLDTHDVCCRDLANGARCIVVSVDYRLSPENKFPAAADDAYAAALWVAEQASALGVDSNRIAVGGDSAGGNLATVACLMARDRGGPALIYQVLIYPVTDFNLDTPSYRENAEGYYLTREKMAYFWNQYLANQADGAHSYASPLRRVDLRGLPPALVVTAGYDPLRDEGETYARRLEEAGVAVTLARYQDMIHGFLLMGRFLEQARTLREECARHLRQAFARGSAAVTAS